MLMTDVEAMILRNQLMMMIREIHVLDGRIDGKANRQRDFLREQIHRTADALNIPREEVL